MKKYIPLLVLIGICCLFFYKTFIFGKIPFPGDLLLTQYAPWRHQSYGGYVAGAIPSKDQYFDVVRELYPWKTQVISQIKSGVFPLWNPYNFSGAPLLANYQSQVFYPLTFLYFILPQITAWTIMVILQPVLGTIFMYFFAVEIGLSSAAAILTAVLFNFSSFANVWIEFTTVWHTILWLPLLLYLVERSVKQQKLHLSQQILYIFALYSAITAGHPQDFINLFLFLIIYIALRRSWSLLFLSIIPFFLAAVQLFPTIELFKNSSRVAHDYGGIIKTMLVQWWQMPLIVVQDFFGNPATKSNFTGDYVGKTLSIGTAGFLFVLTALWGGITSWHKKFFSITAIIILLITIRSPISELLYRYPLPVLSTGTPTRILFILMLALSVLAGYGFDTIRLEKKFLLKPICMGWSILILLWIFTLLHLAIPGLTYTTTAFITMKRSMLLATGIFVALSAILVAARYKKILLLVVIPLVAIELFYGFIKFNPFVPTLFVYPENKLITYLQKKTGIDRFWGYGTAGMEANFATQERIFSTDGTDPLNLKWYNQFIQSSREGNIAATFNRTTRSDAQIQPGYGKDDLPNNEFRLRVMDAFSVKYIIDRSENPKDDNTFLTSRFKMVWHEEDWTVYENLKASPRFFVTSDVRPYSDTVDFERQFFAKDFQPGKTILLHAEDWNDLPSLSGTGTAKLISYTPNMVKIAVNTDSAQLLFLNDTYDTGWEVSVNGVKTKIYAADYAFRAVLVPADNSIVMFEYRPRSFQAGLALSITTLILLTTGVSIHIYNRRRSK